MSTRDPHSRADSSALAIAREFYCAQARGDQRALARLLAPDVETFAPKQLPWGGYWQGQAGLSEMMRRKLDALDGSLDIEQLIGAGDRVVVVAHARGRVRASGAAFSLPVVHVLTIRGACIGALELYCDTNAVARMLGAHAAEESAK